MPVLHCQKGSCVCVIAYLSFLLVGVSVKGSSVSLILHIGCLCENMNCAFAVCVFRHGEGWGCCRSFALEICFDSRVLVDVNGRAFPQLTTGAPSFLFFQQLSLFFVLLLSCVL